MVRVILCLWLLAGPAAAACVDLPKAAISDTGERVDFLARSGGDVTYETVMSNGKIGQSTMRNGFFQMRMAIKGEVAERVFTWPEQLPLPEELPLDQPVTFKGTMTDGQKSGEVTMTLTALRHETVSLGGCDYPVIVVNREMWMNGQPWIAMTVWYAPTQAMPLQYAPDMNDPTTLRRMVRLE
ncbi:hypothetical protein [Stagnihabitans tardus]|uniref:DUF3108 domain-containing protein n=1 Tax=Stagnihabitans tardus TaxID=2699202 RepID=A0AAE4YB34_9RHOB|nr:hypothetical protein [Stagnihabitans tardus]NBZ88674.1 hypothetical protein [Stagnihabitans tardus]